MEKPRDLKSKYCETQKSEKVSLQKFKITCFDILEGNLYKGRDKLISEKNLI